MQQVKAVIIDQKYRYAYVGRFLRERFSDSLGLVPAIFVLLALLLAGIVRVLDVYIASTAGPDSWIMGSTVIESCRRKVCLGHMQAACDAEATAD